MKETKLERIQRMRKLLKDELSWANFNHSWYEAILDEGKPKIRFHDREHVAFNLIGVILTDYEITTNEEAANTNYAWTLTVQIVNKLNS